MMRFTKITAIIICICIALLFSILAEAASVLSDPELEGISSGGVSYTSDGQMLPQDTQLPNQSGDFSADPGPQYEGGMDRLPQTMAVLQSTVNLSYERNLLLGGSAQKNLIALNAENDYSSDAVAATNVMDGHLLVPVGTTPRLSFVQTNQSGQLHRQQGHLYSSQAGYRYETSTLTRTASEDYNNNVYSRIDQHDRTETYSLSASSWDVEVGKISTQEMTRELFSHLPRIDRERIFHFGGFDLGGTVTSPIDGKEYGAEVKYNGISFYGPAASIDSLVSQQNDLLIEATLKLPELDFGEITGCIGRCEPQDYETLWDVGSIGGTNIFSILQKVDDQVSPSDVIAFSDDGIVLKGMGSILEDELNLNTGFVLAGKGRLELLEPASVVIGGEVSFNSTLKTNFWIDPTVINEIIEGVTFGLAKDVFDPWSTENEYPLINVSIPFTLVNIEVDPFVIEYNGLVIAQLGAGDVSADELKNASADYTFRDNSRLERSFTEDTGTSTFNESFEQSVFVGGRITDAEAELLALSEGRLFVGNASNVTLSAGAQEKMRVLHGVNAVSSITAGGLNIGQMPSLTSGAVRSIQSSFQQRNSFSQKF